MSRRPVALTRRGTPPTESYHDESEEVVPRIAWQDRVGIDPNVRHGEPCIRGTRVPVAVIVGSLADGMTDEEIWQAYPQLTSDDVRAALAYAAEAVRFETLAPLA
jgi:uncharacterized protein (DUF433 family)